MSLVEANTVNGNNRSVVRLDPNDNVAVALNPLEPGRSIRVGGVELVIRDFLPPGHKVALETVPQGGVVRRYGEMIGRATEVIEPGRHVHVHNLAYERPPVNYEFPERQIYPPKLPENTPTFLGYPRKDGRAGTRNYIAVVALSNCAAHTVELVVRSFEGTPLPPGVDGVVSFPHQDGCGMAAGRDLALLQRTLTGIIDHPNVGAAVIIGLGCEVNHMENYIGAHAARSERLAALTLQSSGGTLSTVNATRRRISLFIEELASERRQVAPASKLVVGLKCGGSDSLSGITANPALGCCSDLLVQNGGTVILAETPEVVGAEHLLVRKAKNRQVAQRLLELIESYKGYLDRFEAGFDDNPSPGNKEGGLSNIVEKSLGAVAKAGSSPLMDAIDYAERPTCAGFVFMNTPGYDPVSVTGLAAGGANLIVFTTGRGSALGFPTVPVLKVASNTATYEAMRDNMDLNAGVIAEGTKDVAEMGGTIFDLLLEIASGQRTASERLGHGEFAPWRIGPVL